MEKMRLLPRELMHQLVCPECKQQLELRVLSKKRRDGLFRCKQGHCYPIIDGLPKMLVEGLEGDYSQFTALYRDILEPSALHLRSSSSGRLESRQVQETFREKWTSRQTMGISDSSPYKKFMRDWMLRKYGWGSEQGFAAHLESRKLILDAGAGLGREVINMAKVAQNSLVVGLEFSDCAADALKNVSQFDNAYIIQGDILKMPFASESFDFILAEGVLHHTPDSGDAFGRCCDVLKPGGEIAFYVYRKKGPLREFADDYIREIMQGVPTEEKWRIAEGLTMLGRALSNANAIVDIPREIPELGVRKGKMPIQRFIYWNFLKCFWNDALPFDENAAINFDWYAPRHGHRHTESEVREWCRANSIDIVWFHEEESGFTVRGVKMASVRTTDNSSDLLPQLKVGPT